MSNEIYRERACLVAFLSKVYPSSLESSEFNGSEPGFDWIIFIETDKGQLSWHLHNDDLGLFDHVKRDQGWVWDGHTTPEKYKTLAALSPIKLNISRGSKIIK